MKHEDFQISGKEVGPVSIDCHLDLEDPDQKGIAQAKAQSLIGPARILLGNLKHRMQFNHLFSGIDRKEIPPETVYNSANGKSEIVSSRIVVSSIKGSADIDKIDITVLVREKEEEKKGVICLGYIVQIFSSDPEYAFDNGEDIITNYLDSELTTPSGKKMVYQAPRLPSAVLTPDAFQGFPDYNAYYADTDNYPELQILLHVEYKTTQTYDLNGPPQCEPTVASFTSDHFTVVWEYTETTGVCGVVGGITIYWHEQSHGTKTYNWTYEAAISDGGGTGHWETVGSATVVYPGYIYSGGHFIDGFALCRTVDSTILNGEESAAWSAYTNYIEESGTYALMNEALQITYDSYTAGLHNNTKSQYIGLWKAKDSPLIYSDCIVRRKDGNGFILYGGFEIVKLNDIILHDQTEREQYGAMAVFMLPDGQANTNYRWCDAIVNNNPAPYTFTNPVSTGAITYGLS